MIIPVNKDIRLAAVTALRSTYLSRVTGEPTPILKKNWGN